MAGNGSITLESIIIKGANVPDSTSGFLCSGPGYDVYGGPTSSDARIALTFRLPRDSYQICARILHYIVCLRD